MTLIAAILLGLIQGLTEFLPVSSSAHLVIFGQLLADGANSLLFDVAVHIGTLGAVLLYYRIELLRIVAAWPQVFAYLRREPLLSDVAQDIRLSWQVIIGTLPAVVIGLAFKDWIERAFSAPLFTSVMLILTGVILWTTRFVSARSHRPEQTSLTTTKAFFIGLGQAVAILPGISRSGTTITTALHLGLSGEDAAKFSFFLSIPAILGAAVLTLLDLEPAQWLSQPWPAIALGTGVSFIFGYAAIALLLRFIRQGKFQYFAYYCWLIGLLGLIHFWNS